MLNHVYSLTLKTFYYFPHFCCPGEVVSIEICPSIISLTKRLTYIELNSILDAELNDTISSAAVEPIKRDLVTLNKWALLRRKHRNSKYKALDEYLRDKTDLSLTVQIVDDEDKIGQAIITSDVVNSNSSGSAFVTEFMILMSESVGHKCNVSQTSVRYKVQDRHDITDDQVVEKRVGETAMLRTRRLVQSLRPARDSKTPGDDVNIYS